MLSDEDVARIREQDKDLPETRRRFLEGPILESLEQGNSLMADTLKETPELA